MTTKGDVKTYASTSPPDGKDKFLSFGEGLGGNRLFNIPALSHETVMVCEGETDVITAPPHEFENALSWTAGAGNWSNDFNEQFEKKNVVLAYDVDAAGRKGAESVAQALSGVARSVKIIDLPLDHDIHPHGDPSDFLQEQGEDALRSVIDQTPPMRRTITVSTDMQDVVDAAESALLEADFGIYQCAGLLVRIGGASGKTTQRVQQDVQPATIDLAPKAWLRERMSQSADWVSMKNPEPLGALPPTWAVDALIACEKWRFPMLAGIVHSPCLRPDGTLLLAPGYNAETGLYNCSDRAYPAIPESPKQSDALDALNVLWEPFQDFSFAGGDEEDVRKEN